MESKFETALEKRKQGYNCAQAVLCTYCDSFNMDEETAFRIAEGFGTGMATMNGTCGALSGAIMLAGLKTSNGFSKIGSSKADTYALVKKMTEEFNEMNSSTICRELKGIDDGQVKRTCVGCIEDSIKLIEKYIVK